MSQLFTLVGLDAGTAKLSQPVEVTYEQNKKDGVVTHKTRIHYSLAALTIVAGVFCLGAEACHHQITLKWCAHAALTEEGWADAAAMRCGIFVLGKGGKWIGWHGFGIILFTDYLIQRATLGPQWGLQPWDASLEFDPNLLSHFQVRLGYHLYLAMVPYYTRVFNCKNRGKSAEYNFSGDYVLGLLSCRSAFMCSAIFVRAPCPKSKYYSSSSERKRVVKRSRTLD